MYTFKKNYDIIPMNINMHVNTSTQYTHVHYVNKTCILDAINSFDSTIINTSDSYYQFYTIQVK